MADIRPPSWPVVTTPAQPGSQRPGAAARASAQRAFFQAALNGQTAAAPEPPRATAAPIRPTAQTTAQPAADRIPRPGSILNILV